jgi:hypothetical protein
MVDLSQRSDRRNRETGRHLDAPVPTVNSIGVASRPMRSREGVGLERCSTRTSGAQGLRDMQIEPRKGASACSRRNILLLENSSRRVGEAARSRLLFDLVRTCLL